MLTVDTVTDDQIRLHMERAEKDLAYEFYWYKDNKHLFNNARTHGAALRLREIIAVCKSALNPACHEERRTEARRRCVESINGS